MHPCWQLLERHASELNSAPVLWLDPPEVHELMKPGDQSICLDQRVDADSPIPTLRPDQLAAESIHRVVLFYPKAKHRLDWWLECIDRKGLDCPVWVVGENNGGVKSLPKRTATILDSEKLDSARHCALFQCRFIAPIEAQHSWQSYQVGNHQINALPGVFSQGKLDIGTRLLLEHLPELKGHLFELGCGAGAISLTLLSANPHCTLVTSDIDLLAVQSTQFNIEQAGLESRCQVIWSDGMSQVPKQRFDALITNPPFHAGIKTHYAPTEQFFISAEQWLKSGGVLWWVANDFLDYRSLLGASFRKVEEVAHQNGFRVFKATR